LTKRAREDGLMGTFHWRLPKPFPLRRNQESWCAAWWRRQCAGWRAPGEGKTGLI